MYYTYVLYSDHSSRIYIGFTTNIDQRLASHNSHHNRGWTSRYRPWRIIHMEVFESKTEALDRERQLKSAKGREFIRKTFIAP